MNNADSIIHNALITNDFSKINNRVLESASKEVLEDALIVLIPYVSNNINSDLHKRSNYQTSLLRMIRVVDKDIMSLRSEDADDFENTELESAACRSESLLIMRRNDMAREKSTIKASQMHTR